ncbi:MAG: hypothetical protein R3F65_04095 [bacterium]
MDRICAECRFFRVTEARPEGDIGKCRLDKVIGVFRDSMRACGSFSRQGETALPPPSPERRRVAVTTRAGGAPARARVGAERVAEVLQTLDPRALKAALAALLAGVQALPVEELARRWSGDMLLVPADDSLKSKDLPLEQLFHKLVMVRDNLRVLEQKINSHATLHDAEKIDLQARLTRCQGAALSLAARWVPAGAGVDADAMAVLLALVEESEHEALALPAPALGDRWQGGRVGYGSEGTVEEPIERFFHRLVVLRDRLMGLEAAVSAHPHVGRDDSAQIAGYVRRCFGSLTTFNVLFKDRADYFSSGR